LCENAGLDRNVVLLFYQGMSFNMNELLTQLKNIQSRIKEIQARLGDKTVDAEAGGGMVRVTLTGRQELKEIKLDPICVDKRDIPMLEDLILAAVNQGIKKSRELASEELKDLAGGLPIPIDLF